jgi:hypothetical protein
MDTDALFHCQINRDVMLAILQPQPLGIESRSASFETHPGTAKDLNSLGLFWSRRKSGLVERLLLSSLSSSCFPSRSAA